MALIALSIVISGGDGDGLIFTDPLSPIEALLDSLPDEYLAVSELTIAAVPVHPEDREHYLHLWAICPRSVLDDEGALYVGRECLNGTVVIAKESTYSSIAAYLTISDLRSGTFLVPVSEDGQIDVLLRTTLRSDITNSQYMADRKLSALVQLVDTEVVVSECGGQDEFWGPQAAQEVYNASGADLGNEALIEVIGGHQLVAESILNNLSIETILDVLAIRNGSTGRTIDIGHPELVPEDPDADNPRRTMETILEAWRTLSDTHPSRSRT